MSARRLALFNGWIVAGMFAVAAWTIARLPAGGQVAIHWGADGRADGQLGHQAVLLILPITSLVLWLLLTFFPQGFAVAREPWRPGLVRALLLALLIAQLLVAIGS